jgi:iron complex outermembrane receptor protein
VTFNAAVFYSDIDGLQVIADARSCSSRVIANAQAKSVGAEFELSAQPTASLDFALSATYAKAEITETRRDAQGQPFAGIRKGNRLPTSPEFQAAASATYSWPFSTALEGFANFTVQHVGSSYTQLADQEAPFGRLDRIPNNGVTDLFNFGGLTINEFNFDPELPSYEIGNLRFGVRTDRYEAAAFINNVWDERAFLSLDRERGSAARIGYLTNTPRTYGVTGRVKF